MTRKSQEPDRQDAETIPEALSLDTAGAARLVGVEEDQVLDWRDRGDRVVVVTRDGRKMEGQR